MANTRKRKNDSRINTTDKLPDVKRVNRNAREQERMLSFNNTMNEISEFLVENEICNPSQVTSKQKIIDNTFNYIKEMNTITTNDILDLTNMFDDNYNYNEMNKIKFCLTQDEAVDIVKNITRIWDEQTGFSMHPMFYQYIDGNSMNDEISNLLMVDYKDIFDLLDYVIDWDRFLTYEQVSFVRANAHNFKCLIKNDDVEYIIWELIGPIYERCIYKN
jgi:hypothetical protein|tara:strand:+ start:297 stop:950 length:654 start_codon:yes stop_codon:yes gene_type:complete